MFFVDNVKPFVVGMATDIFIPLVLCISWILNNSKQFIRKYLFLWKNLEIVNFHYYP